MLESDSVLFILKPLGQSPGRPESCVCPRGHQTQALRPQAQSWGQRGAREPRPIKGIPGRLGRGAQGCWEEQRTLSSEGLGGGTQMFEKWSKPTGLVVAIGPQMMSPWKREPGPWHPGGMKPQGGTSQRRTKRCEQGHFGATRPS